MRNFLTCSFCSMLVLFASCSSNKSVEKETVSERPSFFLFIADDLSYNDLGVTGNQYVNTPTIDGFADNAVVFNKMYTPTAMCAPSRSTLYTGLYPHSHGCHMNHGTTYDSVKSLPHYLKPLGYTVALVGKKHIRPKEVYPFDYVEFDSLESYLQSVMPPVCVIYASNEPHAPHPKGVHSPDSVRVPDKWVATNSTREKLAGYTADIDAMDVEFHNFLQSIKNNNLANNALMIFTSDHGYDYFAKWSCYEAGLHVPFYVQSNGMEIDTGDVDQLTSFIDVLPTFVELGGGTPPNEIDGKSFAALLKGSRESIHDFVYGTQTTRGIYSGLAYPIRSVTDGKWKYICNLNYKGIFQNVITNGWNFDEVTDNGAWQEWLEVKESDTVMAQWVKFYQKRPEEELYNLMEDPSEMNNLAYNDDYADIKTKLSQQLDKWMIAQGDHGMEAEMDVPLKARDMTKVPKE